jgi:Skp family chaperone for outer membrane proteins
MKKPILILLTLAVLVSTGWAQNAPKTMVVDMSALLRDYYKAKEDFAKFQSAVDSANEQIAMMQEEIQTVLEPVADLRARAQNENQQFTEDAAEEAARELASIQLDFNQRRESLVQFQQQTQQNLSNREQQIISLHMKMIRDVVTDYAEANGYDLVANRAVGVVFVRSSYDQTDAILAILNADAPADAG